jgi:hypothetical protein
LPSQPEPQRAAPVSRPSLIQQPQQSPFEKDLKENSHLADFVKYMGLKLVGIKKETKNGYAANASLNAENADSNAEDTGELAEPEL